MQTVKIATSQNIEIDYAVAGLKERVLARLIDSGIFMVLYYFFLVVFLAVSGTSRTVSNTTLGIQVIIIGGVYLVLYTFYDLICELFFNGQSIGKRAMKIRVVSLTGARPTVGQYIMRWLFRILDFGITLGSLAVVSVALSDKKQRTGDIVADTTVIKTQPLTQFNDLVFKEPAEDHVLTYTEVSQLADQDIALVHEVIRYFNRTRNSLVVYKLAMRIKEFLNVSYSREINEYQFLEIIVQDYSSITAR